MKDVIASYCICNTASLNIYSIDGDYVEVALNDGEIENIEINSYIDEDWEIKGLEDKYNMGFKFGERIYFLDEFTRL